MKMKKIIAAIAILISIQAKAQIYTPEAGRSITFLKLDSSLAIPVRDTGGAFISGREVKRPGLLRVRPADSLLYIYTGTKWSRVGIDSAGLAGMLGNKVDSVKILTDTLFYYVNGVAHGAVFSVSSLYPTGISFNVSTGDATITRNGTTPISGNFDGRYSLQSHTHSGLNPIGGTTGQILKKNSGADYDYSWQTEAAGYVATSRTLTINGVAYDLSADRSWTVGVPAFPYVTSKYLNGYGAFATLSTDSTTEGSTNLFWTNSRFDTRFGTKTSDNLTEGSTNLYYTTARSNLKLNVSDSNIYYPYRSNPLGYLTSAILTGYLQKSDSSIYYTKFRSDTSRNNIYTAIAGKVSTETDPTVDAIIKAIPVTTDVTTNKYYYWNNGSIGRKQIPYSDISGTPSLSGYELLSNKATNLTLPDNTKYPTTLAVTNAIAGIDFSPYELISNKSTSTSLGTSNTLYPTQNAVKVYVDNGLSAKQNTITTGTTSQYFRGDLSLATFPTIPAQFNPIAGTNVTLSGSYPNITINASGGGGTYSAGWGLTLTGSTFKADSSQVASIYNLHKAITDSLNANAFTLTNLGGSGDTLLVPTSTFRAGLKRLIAGSNITLTQGDSSITIAASGGGAMVYPGAGIPLSTGSAWGTSITNNSANWNTAYGWGNHAGLYPLLSGSYSNPSWINTLAWSKITGAPSFLTANQTITLSGDVSGSGTTAITTTIGANKVTNAMLAGSIAVSKLSITGTPDGTKFLRDDGTWQNTGSGSSHGDSAYIKLTLLPDSTGFVLWRGNGGKDTTLFIGSGGGSGGLSASNFITEEIPSGTINGTNPTFTLANTPVTGSVKIYLRGLRMSVSGGDYTISGSTITMINIPGTGDPFFVDYIK